MSAEEASTMSIYTIFLGALCICAVSGQRFNRNVVGVAFSPYTDVAPARNWDQYSVDDIMSKLSLVRNHFSIISTYSMGVAGYNVGKNWDQCDSNALVARAAARLNQQSGTKLNVNIGVFQNTEGHQQREIDNAFAAAADANGLAGGTVTGITFTNEYIDTATKGDDVLAMIRNNKARANNMGLHVGIRTQFCDIYTNSGHPLRGVMESIARESDYIYCNLYPSQEHASQGPSKAADEVMNFYFYLKSEIQKINPNLEVMIGETGWPSEGKSFNNSPNTVSNEVAYWNAINTWASNTGVKVQMFQAIDEPWKGWNTDINGEGHYGWWSKPNNNDGRIIEKETGN